MIRRGAALLFLLSHGLLSGGPTSAGVISAGVISAGLISGCAKSTPIMTDDAGPEARDGGPLAMDAGATPGRDAGPPAIADAGPPRSCDLGCGVFERCLEGLCQPYPPCRGDGSCPDGAACFRRMCLPVGEDLDGDGSPVPEDCVEGDASIYPGAAETCNATDDDCDGASDEGVTQACSTACGDGTETCNAGAFEGCTATPPVDETCNAIDDDCDGAVDEALTRACASACGEGTETCALGSYEGCTAPPPAPEVCNGLDDDCDGVVDGMTRPCSTICGGGVETCTAGAFGGCTARTPSAETCNGVDDDCDGVVDGMTRPCSSACGSGTETCRSGSYGGCTAPPVPAETCNLADDDCNGVCDDGGCRHGVHRSVHPTSGEHFYTVSRSEAACCGFRVEFYDFYWLYDAPTSGLVPFYRCLLSSGFHFYTTSSTCEGSPGARNESVLGYIATSPRCGSTPLYRLVRSNDHFYTTSASERDSAIASGYRSEGTAGHVWARP